VNIDTLEKAQESGRAPWTDVEINTKEFVVFNDGFPVTEGHMLIVPKVSDQETITKCFKFAISMGNDNVVSDKTTITGFNIGLNIGKSAGQTVMYPHVHLIFRRDGDCPDPVGGVRNVIPGKGNYRKEL
jgi:diadenosine tetraphosphate (Ap4A) HIT family hydrolase